MAVLSYDFVSALPGGIKFLSITISMTLLRYGVYV